MGYLRGLTHGAIVGAIVGLLYAPESGIEMRRRVARLLGQAEDLMANDGNSSPPAAGGAPRRRAAGGSESRARRP